MTSLYPVAQRSRCRLKYAESIVLATSAIFTGDYTWMINSLFDPNFTGGGHQPRGFDQLSAFYNRYRVYGVHYKVTCLVAADQIILTVYPSNQTTAPSTFQDAAEQAMSKWTVLQNAAPGVITGYVDLCVLNGKTRVAYEADDTTQALTSASPSEQLCLHTVVTSQSSSNVNTYVAVELEFDCEFSDPIALGGS